MQHLTNKKTGGSSNSLLFLLVKLIQLFLFPDTLNASHGSAGGFGL